MSLNEDSNVKLIPNEDVFRIRGNDKLYAEAMESMVKFNKQLLVERKSRIPFFDTQTGIAQSNAILWHDRSHRSKSSKLGHVYKYSIKSWYKNRRSLFDKDSYSSSDNSNSQQQQQQGLQQSQQAVLNETSNNSNSNLSASNMTASNLINNTNSLLNHLQQTTKSFNDNEYSSKQNLSSTNTNSALLVEDWQEDNYEQYNNFNDENDSDYDDTDEYKPKRSSKKPKISKSKKAELVDEKPYTCDKCGAKYKTKPGLNYHIQKAHSSLSSSASNNASSSNLSSLKINEILNNDENANSIFDSVYDDMNSSSSLRG